MDKNIITGYYNDSAVEYNETFYTHKKTYSPLIERQDYMLALLDEEMLPHMSRVLDIGCGPGEMLLELASRGHETWGIDISEEMIRLANEKTGEEQQNIHLGIGDIENLTFDNNFFDVVIAAGVIEYLGSDDAWIKELSRVLKPNGILIINITNRYAVRRLTLSVFNRMKHNRTIRRAMNFIKKTVLHKGAINYFPFSPRTHAPGKFDAFLVNNGYTKTAHRYFDPSIFPYPFDTVCSCIVNRTRRFFSRHAAGNMVFFGSGYIVKAKKNNT